MSRSVAPFTRTAREIVDEVPHRIELATTCTQPGMLSTGVKRPLISR